jgi:hypothetical protein
LFGEKNNLSNNNFTFQPAPTKSDFFVQELEDLSTIKVRAIIDTTYFLKAKLNYQLKVTKELPNGTIADLTLASLGTTYSLNLDTNIVKISPNGLLSIKRTNLPYINNRLPFLVEVKNGSDVGYGQFAIYDVDNDADLLSDSYEEFTGLDPNVANPLTLDTDQDGLQDFFELSFLTSPLKYDTDGDGYSDRVEMLKGTDANNPLSFPYPIYSLQSGMWNDVNSWSCNCIPSTDDAVIIKKGHNIELNTSMGVQECLKIFIEKGSIFKCEGKLNTTLR